MSEIANDLPLTKETPKIFNRSQFKKYLWVLLGAVGIMGIYYLFSSAMGGMGGSPQMGNQVGNNGPMGSPPTGGSSPTGSNSGTMAGPSGTGMPTGGMNLGSIWPLWGTINVPTLIEYVIAIGIFVGFTVGLVIYYRKNHKDVPLVPIVIVGIILMIGTNMIQGWSSIYSAIGGSSEIYTDSIQINNIITFIKDFMQLESTLSIHAQTQPPGAVIAIYLLYLVFKDPGIIAIALCVISSIGSAYFLNGIFKRVFDEKIAKYAVFSI